MIIRHLMMHHDEQSEDHVLWKIFCLDMEIDADKTNFLFVLLRPFRFSLFVRNQDKTEKKTFHHKVSLQYWDKDWEMSYLLVNYSLKANQVESFYCNLISMPDMSSLSEVTHSSHCLTLNKTKKSVGKILKYSAHYQNIASHLS